MPRPANPELREKILEAATGIVEDCGPDCVTMREVADKVGYSPTTLYIYFKDKQAILREVALRGFDDIAEACDLAMVGPSNLDRFRQRMRGYVMFGMLNPGRYSLMFVSAEYGQLLGDDLRRAMVGLTSGEAVVRAAIEAGELPDDVDPRKFTETAWAAGHGATSLAISQRLAAGLEDKSPQALVEAATTTTDRLIDALVTCSRVNAEEAQAADATSRS